MKHSWLNASQELVVAARVDETTKFHVRAPACHREQGSAGRLDAAMRGEEVNLAAFAVP